MGVSNPEAFKQINELLFEIHDLFDLTKLTTWSDHKVFARKIRHCCRKLIALNSWNITKTCSMESICKNSHFTPTSRAGIILEREYETREKHDAKSMVDFFAMVRFNSRLGDWWEAYHLIETLQHFIEAKRDIHESEFLNEFRNLVGIFMLLKHELTPTKEDQHNESTMLWKWTLYSNMTYESEDDREAAFRNMSQEKLAYEVSKLNDAEWARDREYYNKIDLGRVDPIFGNADNISAKIDLVSKLAKCDKKQATIALSMNHDNVDKAIAYVNDVVFSGSNRKVTESLDKTKECNKKCKMSKPKIKTESTSIPDDCNSTPHNVTIPDDCNSTPHNVTIPSIVLSGSHSKAVDLLDKNKDCDKECDLSKAIIKSESTSIPGNNAATPSNVTSIPGNNAATPSNVTSIGSNCIAYPTDTVAIMGDGSFSPKPKANKKRKVNK